MSDFITACPACQTHFKVQEDVLAASAGKGRCSACQHVFNAFEHKVEPDLAVVTEAPTVESVAMPDIQASDVTPFSFDEKYDAEDTSSLADLLIDEPEVEPALEPEPLPVVPVPESLFQKRRINWSNFFKPLAAVILLLLLLVMQSALFFRASLVEQYPRSYFIFAASCKLLNCSVELPRRAVLVQIEDHSLRSDPEYVDVLVLDGVIKNSAPYPQAYPVLQLTLTSSPNFPVANRSFAPEEYLGKGSDIKAGMAAGSSVNIHLKLGVTGVQSNAYQLIARD
jgi:predicted Zn finger-like uncharacterized protein